MRKKKFWAGFCDDKIHIAPEMTGYDAITLFVKRKDAKRCYMDVRAVEIREIK